MRSHTLTHAGLRLARWRSRHNLRQAGFWVMVAAGPLLAIATSAVLSEMSWLGGRDVLRPVLLADFVYALIVATFVARRVFEMVAARRRRSAGSKLHMRLVRFFTLIALIPTVLVAVFATVTLNFGLEGWFSDRVRNVVANSMAAAEAYEEEHRITLQTDARALGDYLNDQKERDPLLAGGQLRDMLTRGQLQMQRALPKAYIIDGDGEPASARRAQLSVLVHAAVGRGPRPGAHRRGGDHPGLGEQRVLGAAATDVVLRPLPLREPRGRRQDPEPARRHPGDGAPLPAAGEGPGAAAVRVRAGLSRVRAGGDPGGDVGRPVVRRAAGAAGGTAGRRGGAGGAGGSRTYGCARSAATTRSHCWAARSTR